LRRSIDGLAALVRERFTLDPLSGHLFLFRNRRGDRIKILAWDRGGFWVLYKRLERGTFAWPADEDVARVELPGGRPAALAVGGRCRAHAATPVVRARRVSRRKHHAVIVVLCSS
jgi:transposase